VCCTVLQFMICCLAVSLLAWAPYTESLFCPAEGKGSTVHAEHLTGVFSLQAISATWSRAIAKGVFMFALKLLCHSCLSVTDTFALKLLCHSCLSHWYTMAWRVLGPNRSAESCSHCSPRAETWSPSHEAVTKAQVGPSHLTYARFGPSEEVTTLDILGV